MRHWVMVSALAAGLCGCPAMQAQQTPTAQQPQGASAGGDVGHGAGDIGKGAGEGTGKAAEGVGKGAVAVGTLHPVKGGEDIGKGAGEGGKDVGEGAVKGTGKLAKVTGKALASPFHHHKEKQADSNADPK